MTLLNRAMYKHTATLGVRFDPPHWRFYFPAEEAGKERVVRYRPLNMASGERKVAWEARKRVDRGEQGFLVAPGRRPPLSPHGRRPVVSEHPTRSDT